jgi:RNA polymerase sigma factor (sigma-70 family)
LHFFQSASTGLAVDILPSPIIGSFNVGSVPLLLPHEQIAATDHSLWFTAEVQPHEAALRAYLRGRFPGLADVDDLVQETYARLLRAKVAGKLHEVRPYLFVIARNAALDLARHHRVAATDSIGNIEHLSVVEDRSDVAETVSYGQEIEILHEAIAALPPRCREVLVLRRFHGLSHEKISRQLNISVNTVDAQLCLAVLRCRQFLLLRGVSRDCLAGVSSRTGA